MQNFRDIMAVRLLEYGRRPEFSFSAEVVGSAKLGSGLLRLSVNGDHYADKRYIRRKLILDRIDRRGPTYHVHLRDYQGSFCRCQGAWISRFM